MKFSHFFIDRPIFATVLSVVIVLVGGLALLELPVAQYPNIVPPTIMVTARYPGANPQVLADTVAAPIEQEVNGVEDMLYMSAQCAADGSMTLTITFKLGTDIDKAQVQVQNRVAVAEPKLPEEVRRLGITTAKRSPDITLVVNLISPDGRYDKLYIDNYANLQVKDALARLPGVGNITIFGARDYSMRVWLDPDRVSSRGLTANDVVNAIREQNVQVAAGVLGQQPMVHGVHFQFTVNAQGRLTDEEQFGEIVIKTGEDGQVTRVHDVARVELAARDYSMDSKLNGQPNASLGIFQLPGSNSIQTSDAVRELMKKLKQRQEEGLNRFDAAVEASRLRLRPILMTSLAFIFGVLPLVLAKGAGAEMRQALGTAVFFGMLGVTFFGIFLTPVFYYVIRWVTERGRTYARSK
jgi:multidrug efflux pump subunit AcrB